METLQGSALLEYLLLVSRRMMELNTVDPLLRYIIHEIILQVGAERGYIILKNEDGTLNFSLQQDNAGQTLTDGADEVSHSLLHQVIDSKQGLVLGNALTDPKFRMAESVTNLRLRSVMCVPLITLQKTIGAIYLENRSLSDQFNQEHFALLELFANQAAVAIENAHLSQKIQHELAKHKQSEESLKTYSEQLEERVEARTQELYKTQEQLNRQEKLAVLGQLAGGVGNELRNPLGIISNAAYFLSMVLSGADDTTHEYLNIITSRVQESEQIVSDLLNLSRNQPAELENFSPFQLVGEVLETYPPPDIIKVTSNLVSELPQVGADYQHIQQALGNVLLNAYEALPNGGQIELNAVVNNSFIQLSISDTGSGMSLETLDKIFDPLFTTKAKAIGLGLAVAKNLVEINRGDITVESTQGQGTILMINLPLNPRPTK